ncbi:cytidylyltransferase domain-containing protein [Bacillus pinisoli]|uniref:acylneuraminate cytidylyltransferase family protein n=1 Tax=Bacillus pinisoli TaxID=2901866 RepID=UPI001FF2D32A|nr:acylneuraminate cytidylyltransferase family protein [Bacillus pinisoli]
MYKNKSFLAVIPARGGSKGIPGKNIINVNGKPLIQYTIDAAMDSKYLDRVVVSTDDSEIALVSTKCGAEVPFLRPPYLADDTAKTIDVLIHALEELNNDGCNYDYIVLLQPTQPLRTAEQIDLSIQKIVHENEESLVSITEVNEHPILFRTLDSNGMVHNMLSTDSTVRRQDFPKIYKVNGAIYINKINHNFNSNTSLNDNKLAFVMEQKFDIDIDEPHDIEVLKLKLNAIK